MISVLKGEKKVLRMLVCLFPLSADNEKERLSGLEKIKQLREQVNELFSRKFGKLLLLVHIPKHPHALQLRVCWRGMHM